MKIFLFSVAIFLPLITILLRKILALQFSVQVKHIISSSFDFAVKSKQCQIGTDLFLYAIVKDEVGVAFQLLKYQGFKTEIFVKDFENKVNHTVKMEETQNINLTGEAEECLAAAAKSVKKIGGCVNSAQLLKAIVRSNSIVRIADKYQIPTNEFIDLTLRNTEYKARIKIETPEPVFERIRNNFF